MGQWEPGSKTEVYEAHREQLTLQHSQLLPPLFSYVQLLPISDIESIQRQKRTKKTLEMAGSTSVGNHEPPTIRLGYSQQQLGDPNLPDVFFLSATEISAPEKGFSILSAVAAWLFPDLGFAQICDNSCSIMVQLGLIMPKVVSFKAYMVV